MTFCDHKNNNARIKTNPNNRIMEFIAIRNVKFPLGIFDPNGVIEILPKKCAIFM